VGKLPLLSAREEEARAKGIREKANREEGFEEE
jgi:hypothetical protein